MLRRILLALALATSLALPAAAQSPNLASVVESIRQAAANDRPPSALLTSTAVELIAIDPSLLEVIISEALRAAPDERAFIQERVAFAYPIFAARIAAIVAGRPMPAPVVTAAPRRIASAPPARQSIAPAPALPRIIAAPPPAPAPAPKSAQAFTPPPIVVARLSEDRDRSERGISSGLYADMGIGLTILKDADLKDNRLGGQTGNLLADTGLNLSGAVGYKFSQLVRAELEVNYRSNSLDTLSVGGFGLTTGTKLDGTVRQLSTTANAYIDLPFGGKLIPYIGGGLGISSINYDIATANIDEWDTVFALQAAAGVRYPIFEQAWIRAGYKIFAAADPKIGGTESEYISHNFEIGYYYEF
jgi:opacity protein-like surface antigen